MQGLKPRVNDPYKTAVLLHVSHALLDIASRSRYVVEWGPTPAHRSENLAALRSLEALAEELGMYDNGKTSLYKKPLAMVYDSVARRLDDIARLEKENKGYDAIVRQAEISARIMRATQDILKGLEACGRHPKHEAATFCNQSGDVADQSFRYARYSGVNTWDVAPHRRIYASAGLSYRENTEKYSNKIQNPKFEFGIKIESSSDGTFRACTTWSSGGNCPSKKSR